ncbi:MAG: endonuclease domain-containing protein [Actinomycetota bacterium]|nr:endonuclease domain-containing protein [Actinomycetota bacterium]
MSPAFVAQFGGLDCPSPSGTFRSKRRTEKSYSIWREASVAVEIDGAWWHLDAAAREADQRRQNAIQASGVLVLRFSVHRLIHDVDGVLDEIRAVLARAITS